MVYMNKSKHNSLLIGLCDQTFNRGDRSNTFVTSNLNYYINNNNSIQPSIEAKAIIRDSLNDEILKILTSKVHENYDKHTDDLDTIISTILKQFHNYFDSPNDIFIASSIKKALLNKNKDRVVTS